jgi:hypothetical protein
MRWLCDKSLGCSPALPPGRVPHVRGLSRTWVEHDLFPMLSPPVHHLTYRKRKGGASPGFPVEFGGIGEPHAAFLTESRTRCRWRVPRIRKSGSPRFPVEFGGIGEPHAAFLTESRTRCRWRVPRIRKSGSPILFNPCTRKSANMGHPSRGQAWWESGKRRTKTTANTPTRRRGTRLVKSQCRTGNAKDHLLTNAWPLLVRLFAVEAQAIGFPRRRSS